MPPQLPLCCGPLAKAVSLRQGPVSQAVAVLLLQLEQL